MQGTLLNSYWVWLVVTYEIRVCVAVHSVIDTERASLTCCFVGSMSEDGYEMGNIVFMALCIAILVMLILTSLSCLCMCQKHYNAEPDGGRHVPHVSIHVSYRVSCCCFMWTRGGWGVVSSNVPTWAGYRGLLVISVYTPDFILSLPIFVFFWKVNNKK